MVRAGDEWLMFLARGPEVLLARSADGLKFARDEKFVLQGGGLPGAVVLKDGKVRIYQCGHEITSVVYDPRSGRIQREEGVRIGGAGDPAVWKLAEGGYIMVFKSWMREDRPPERRPPPGGEPGPKDRSGQEPPAQKGPADLKMWSQGKAEGQGPVKLTHSPMRLEDIDMIIPYGQMGGAHVMPTDHQYYYPKDWQTGRKHYDVIAPAAGFVVQIGHRVQFFGSTEKAREYDDYSLVIEHSSTFYSRYDLLTRLDPFLLDKLDQSIRDKFAKKAGGGPHPVRIPVKAGQVIGKVGGRSLDFDVVNSEVTLKGFLTPRLYGRAAWRIHLVDPFDYFEEPLRDQLLKLNLRKAKPLGGKIDYDIDGKLVGNWFKEGTGGYDGNRDKRGYWMGHLAIVYHHLDPAKVIVSIGD